MLIEVNPGIFRLEKKYIISAIAFPLVSMRFSGKAGPNCDFNDSSTQFHKIDEVLLKNESAFFSSNALAIFKPVAVKNIF